MSSRRNPRYPAFLTTGAVVGVMIAVVLTLSRTSNVEEPARLFAYLASVLAGLGALLGGVVAVVVEGRKR